MCEVLVTNVAKQHDVASLRHADVSFSQHSSAFDWKIKRKEFETHERLNRIWGTFAPTEHV